MKKNCILLLLDSLTFDTINSAETSSILFPNLYKLSNKFKFKKCVANSNCTQFVLPSLFSMTMPLDEGGYDYGVKNRHVTIMEILKKEGFKTLIFSNCNQMGADNGYDRGVDENINSFDYRLILEQKLNRVILHKYKKNNQNLEKDKKLILDYKNLLIEVKTRIDNSDTLIWSDKLKKINFGISKNITKELELIELEPNIILKKLLTINPASIWRFLGVYNLKDTNFFFIRLLTSFNWRLKYMITKSILPINILGHSTINIIDKFYKFKDKIRKLDKPFFLYHHIMDLHDYENFNSFNFFIKKISKFSKWYKNTKNLKRKRKFLYDSTLMLIDDYIGKVIKSIDKDTCLFITSDHGHRKSLKKQIPRFYFDNDKFNEMHGEDIEVPIISNINFENIEKDKKLFDTISFSKTIMDILDINVSGYTQKNNQEGQLIISEHSGRGSFDLRKNLYFTVSGLKSRMLLSILNDEIFFKFYNIIDDPDEINDISQDENYKEEIKFFFDFLFKTRKDILSTKLKSIKKIHNNFIKETYEL